MMGARKASRALALAELLDCIPDRDSMSAVQLAAALGVEEAREVFRQLNEQITDAK